MIRRCSRPSTSKKLLGMGIVSYGGFTLWGGGYGEKGLIEDNWLTKLTQKFEQVFTPPGGYKIVRECRMP